MTPRPADAGEQEADPLTQRTLGRVDIREQIDIGAERPAVPVGPDTPDYWILQGPNLWPEALPELREVGAAGKAALTSAGDTGRALRRLVSADLALARSAFERAFALDPDHREAGARLL